MSFDLNINIQVGVTPDLAALLAALRLYKPGAGTAAATQNVLQDAVNNHPSAPAAGADAAAVATQAADTTATAAVDPTPTEATAATDTVPEAVAEAQEAAKQKARDLGVEVREIMHRTRQRFEGENYKENTDSEHYKKYHRQLTAQFKQIASLLGYEKPSAIDTPEKVDSFAAQCDDLYIAEDGSIATKVPY